MGIALPADVRAVHVHINEVPRRGQGTKKGTRRENVSVSWGWKQNWLWLMTNCAQFSMGRIHTRSYPDPDAYNKTIPALSHRPHKEREAHDDTTTPTRHGTT